MDTEPDSDECADIAALCSCALPTPLYVETAALLVYTLILRLYVLDMPTDTILRLWIHTDSGDLRSDNILVTFGR